MLFSNGVRYFLKFLPGYRRVNRIQRYKYQASKAARNPWFERVLVRESYKHK